MGIDLMLLTHRLGTVLLGYALLIIISRLKCPITSGQCLTSIIRASCCSARLSRAQVLLCPGQEKKGGGNREWGGGTACTGGYKRVQAVRPGSVAGGGTCPIFIGDL